LAAFFAEAKTGIKIAARIAMIAIATSNSISVNARFMFLYIEQRNEIGGVPVSLPMLVGFDFGSLRSGHSDSNRCGTVPESHRTFPV
jgi:hypothetical protein